MTMKAFHRLSSNKSILHLYSVKTESICFFVEGRGGRIAGRTGVKTESIHFCWKGGGGGLLAKKVESMQR